MSREIPYDPEATCDECGAEGAFDFMGDLLCQACTWIPRTVHPTYKCPVCGAPAMRGTHPDEWCCDECLCHPWYWPEDMTAAAAIAAMRRYEAEQDQAAADVRADA